MWFTLIVRAHAELINRDFFLMLSVVLHTRLSIFSSSRIEADDYCSVFHAKEFFGRIEPSKGVNVCLQDQVYRGLFSYSEVWFTECPWQYIMPRLSDKG